MMHRKFKVGQVVIFKTALTKTQTLLAGMEVVIIGYKNNTKIPSYQYVVRENCDGSIISGWVAEEQLEELPNENIKVSWGMGIWSPEDLNNNLIE